MTQLIRISPIASKTVDTKLNMLLEANEIELSEKDDLETRPLEERNDLKLENIENTPYSS